MAEDWAADVRKYVPDADDGIIAGIVRYCGIALQKRDSSLVSFSDPKELARVRNNFLKKKLALERADDVLDAAIAKVGDRMKADRTKNRVTVYYLLAEDFGLLSVFEKKVAAKKAAPAGSKTAEAKKPAAKKKAVAAEAAPAAVASLATVGKGAKNAASAAVDAAADIASKAADTTSHAAAEIAGSASKVGSAAANAATGAVQGLVGESKDATFPRWLVWLLGLFIVAWLVWYFILRTPA